MFLFDEKQRIFMDSRKTDIAYLRSVLEPRVGKKLTEDQVINIVLGFTIRKIECDEFEQELIDYAKQKLKSFTD